MCLGTLLYHENRKKSQIVVFPWVLIKSVIVLYLVFVPSLHLKFYACLFFIHWLPRITGYQLLSQRVFFFFENLGIGIIIGLFSFTHGSTSIEFSGGDPVPLCISNLVADLVGCWYCSNGLSVCTLYVICTDSLLV